MNKVQGDPADPSRTMRALILSDIHGNLEALEAVLAAAGTVDAIWNLGDVVGYGASPNEVIDRIRPIAAKNVRGNHDRVCAGQASAANFNPIAREAAEWTRDHLTPGNTAWLANMPAGPVVCAAENVALAHGSPLNEDTYIVGIRDAWSPLEQMQHPITFFGHTHLQGGFGWEAGRWFEIRTDHCRKGRTEWKQSLAGHRRYLLNPGSVGQPRDNDPRAAYAILDTEARHVTFHREPYDIDLAQGRILLAGLPERLAKRLREGR